MGYYAKVDQQEQDQLLQGQGQGQGQEQHKRMVILLDIDNTLYNDQAVGSLSAQMRAALINYVRDSLHMSFAEAKSFVERCFHEYGLTICGMVHKNTGIKTEAVTDFVYNCCDFTRIEENTALCEILSLLQSKYQHSLYYLTNAPRRHATTVLERLGLTKDEFTLKGFSYEDQWAHTEPVVSNKPMRSAYSAIYRVLQKEQEGSAGIVPHRMVMVDDCAHNLVEPLAMGWSAMWVSHGAELPIVLLASMESGRLVCVGRIEELEDALHRLLIQIENIIPPS